MFVEAIAGSGKQARLEVGLVILHRNRREPITAGPSTAIWHQAHLHEQTHNPPDVPYPPTIHEPLVLQAVP